MKPVQPISDKKPYQGPQLRVYGNISQITQTATKGGKLDTSGTKFT